MSNTENFYRVVNLKIYVGDILEKFSQRKCLSILGIK